MEINKELERYIESHTSKEDDLLKELERITNLHVLQARMLSGHVQGKILEMISCMIRPKYILEIGTFTGYSAICLAKGLGLGGKLHTIEIDDELIDLATSFFQRSDFAERIVLHCGSALDILPKLEITFDLIFIDGDKKQYSEYYELAISKLSPNGFILADNVLWDGKVIEEVHPNDKQTLELLRFNKLVQEDERVENVILPIRDGIMLIRKRNSTNIKSNI